MLATASRRAVTLRPTSLRSPGEIQAGRDPGAASSLRGRAHLRDSQPGARPGTAWRLKTPTSTVIITISVSVVRYHCSLTENSLKHNAVPRLAD